MARDTAIKRKALREALIDIAESKIRAEGLASLRARSLAAEAGCAVGAIYNVFDDLTGLVLAVNGRTFRRLGAFVSEAVAASDGDPTGRLIVMGNAYLAFAAENPHLWRALFDVEMTVDRDVPAWYMDELGRVFSIIAEPLSELTPHLDAQRIDLKTRALFSSVHGIVLLGLERRISGVPRDHLEEMIGDLIHNFTAGLAARTA